MPAGLDQQVAAALARLQERAGRELGDPGDPLLVSVRSGARESMPGMLDTVLNLGLGDRAVEGLAAATGNERFAWDSYRRFAQMFGNVCRGIAGERYEALIAAAKREAGVELDVELSVEALRGLTQRFKDLYAEETGEEFPQDPAVQLRTAIGAVFDSWRGARAVEYRRINGIPEDWGTAVNVQQMVFGNKGERSCSGVAFSRDEITGAPEPSGDFLVNAQGEDVVSGVRTPLDLAEMAEVMPAAHAELMEILRTLEAHYGDMQDTEFTVEDDRLFMLQTRSAKRPAQAGVRFAVDAVGEGLLDKRAALATSDSTPSFTRPSPPTPSSRCWPAASPPRRGRPAARSSSPRPRRSRPAPRVATRSWFAPSPRPRTSPASTRRAGSSPRRAARRRTRRSSPAAWAGPASAAHGRSKSTSKRAR
jgi:pyruvate,orthophosphate dikinase